MHIRLMTIDDYDKVVSLCLSVNGMGLNNIDDSRQGIAKFLDRNPETCFVAEENGIKGVILSGNDGRRGYIYHTVVAIEFQRKGIGAQLLDAALKALSKLGIVKVALLVFEKNKTGNAFWEKQGFTKRTDVAYRNKSLAEIERIDT